MITLYTSSLIVFPHPPRPACSVITDATLVSAPAPRRSVSRPSQQPQFFILCLQGISSPSRHVLEDILGLIASSVACANGCNSGAKAQDDTFGLISSSVACANGCIWPRCRRRRQGPFVFPRHRLLTSYSAPGRRHPRRHREDASVVVSLAIAVVFQPSWAASPYHPRRVGAILDVRPL